MRLLPSPSLAARALAALAPLLSLGCATAKNPGGPPDGDRPPNVVLVFADDLGYGDIGPYGAEPGTTPHLDRMAAEGMKLDSFYVAQAVCSASRAALLTGSYSNRVSILGALGPQAKTGLHHHEVTIAELLESRGYATAIFGKWHLGDDARFLPTRHGFDEYHGIPYSNDMWPHHPERPNVFPPLPLIEGERVVARDPDQRQLTSTFTERAIRFMEKNRSRPFFLYVPHPMPHVPLFVSDGRAGKTGRGLYADVIAEIDWSVGQILAALERLGLDRRTLVIFTSDNGPWLSYGNHAGTAGPLREGKGTTFEGGVRVPALFRWPGRIPGGAVSSEIVLAMDILPTLAGLAGAPLPSDRILDGRDVWPILAGEPGARTPHEAFFYYNGGALEAVRSGPWKLHFAHDYRTLGGGPGGRDGMPARYARGHIDLSLFNLDSDIGETTDLAARHPEIVERLQALAERAREDLGDAATGRVGRNVRPSGRL